MKCVAKHAHTENYIVLTRIETATHKVREYLHVRFLSGKTHIAPLVQVLP